MLEEKMFTRMSNTELNEALTLIFSIQHERRGIEEDTRRARLGQEKKNVQDALDLLKDHPLPFGQKHVERVRYHLKFRLECIHRDRETSAHGHGPSQFPGYPMAAQASCYQEEED